MNNRKIAPIFAGMLLGGIGLLFLSFLFPSGFGLVIGIVGSFFACVGWVFLAAIPELVDSL